MATVGSDTSPFTLIATLIPTSLLPLWQLRPNCGRSFLPHHGIITALRLDLVHLNMATQLPQQDVFPAILHGTDGVTCVFSVVDGEASINSGGGVIFFIVESFHV